MLNEEAIDNQLRCMARLNDEELSETFILKTVQQAVDLQRSEKSQDVIQTREKSRSHAFPAYSIPVVLSAAAVVFIGVAIAWYSTVGRQQDDFGFAQIIDTESLSWELIDKDNRRLHIASGMGEIQYENGTIAQLTAPAVIELRTSDKLFIQTGSVKINVPLSAVGFTVETPVARIVDLGTTFDVDVGEAGQTETRVRTGIVTFETHSPNPKASAPIILTAEELNRASAEVADLTADVRSVETTASGPDGQFFGSIHADGEAVEFDTRQAFDDFRNRLHSSVEKNPSKFREQWKVFVESTSNSTSTKEDSGGESGFPQSSPNDRAQKMLIEQLRSMQKLHHGNPQMQEHLERMIRQAEEHLENSAD